MTVFREAMWLGAIPVVLAAGFFELHAAGRSPARSVRYAPAPEWAAAPPEGSKAPIPPGAPIRVTFSDQQVRVTEHRHDEYQATRMALLTPEALGAGNLAVSWSPSNEEMIVHRLSIIREGRITDVLAQQKFTIIQRENNLEQSALDGELTATLQVAGLQVGDELEFAATKVRHETSLGERAQGFSQLPVAGVRGVYRVRLVEPKDGSIGHRAMAGVPNPIVRELGTEIERQFLLTDPASVTLPDGAPSRYAMARFVQFSGYKDWAAVSRTFGAPFARAAALAANSPLKAEAARIAATSADPERRAEAALRLVQDRIRYVYVGLNGGNYQPASADETWQRRFGDCKGKTVLLIALLRELGIAAEPVLVASKGGDGIDQLLPTPAVFDHVLVRATVGSATFWLDGTRTGDRVLADLEAPPSRWGLPLRASAAALEPIAPKPPRRPSRIQVVEIDASSGFDKPGKYRIQQTLRGDEIFGMRAQLAGLAPADADKALIAYWRQQFSDVEPSRTTWRFDDQNRLLVLGVEGEGKVDWEGDATDGRTHYLFGGGFPPPDEMKRPKDQPQDAPWANDYPSFTCYATIVRVPAAGKGFRWSFLSKPMDRALGGISYWRISSFDGKVARMTKSRRVSLPEISAKEAAAIQVAQPKFDNNKAYVWEVPVKTTGADETGVNAASTFGTFEDFAGAEPPCQSAGKQAVSDRD